MGAGGSVDGVGEKLVDNVENFQRRLRIVPLEAKVNAMSSGSRSEAL